MSHWWVYLVIALFLAALVLAYLEGRHRGRQLGVKQGIEEQIARYQRRTLDATGSLGTASSTTIVSVRDGKLTKKVVEH